MNIVLATGIYPPDIGGPATYVRALAEELTSRGEQVTVITYGPEDIVEKESWKVVKVKKGKAGITRWRRFAGALKEHAGEADIIYCFSSVSVGLPLFMARLTKPLTALRLGGDFLWERYTDRGGRKGLRSFYISFPGTRAVMGKALRTFDGLVYSTTFQERLAEYLFKKLPKHVVIENALPLSASPVHHEKQDLLHLLFLGRFVRFKNLPNLLQAVAKLPYVRLTLIGEGPEQARLEEMISRLGLSNRVKILQSISADKRSKIFAEHDLMVIPSLTEISPNAALEARAAGLPVLLTEETGLSAELSKGMVLRPLKTVEDITRALIEVEKDYPSIAEHSASLVTAHRAWSEIAEETLAFFSTIQKKSKRV